MTPLNLLKGLLIALVDTCRRLICLLGLFQPVIGMIPAEAHHGRWQIFLRRLCGRRCKRRRAHGTGTHYIGWMVNLQRTTHASYYRYFLGLHDIPPNSVITCKSLSSERRRGKGPWCDGRGPRHGICWSHGRKHRDTVDSFQ